VRLGVLVASVPLRPPSVLAKALSTLDVLSDGRLVDHRTLTTGTAV